MEMNNDHTEQKRASASPQKKPRLRLPFDDSRQDFILWIYDNRIGLIVTIVALITLSVAFVTAEISLRGQAGEDIIYIDMGELELLENERDRLLREVQERNNSIDWSAVRNTSSNENALNENLEDEKRYRCGEAECRGRSR